MSLRTVRTEWRSISWRGRLFSETSNKICRCSCSVRKKRKKLWAQRLVTDIVMEYQKLLKTNVNKRRLSFKSLVGLRTFAPRFTSRFPSVAERERFELSMGCPMPVFETGALDHSAPSPLDEPRGPPLRRAAFAAFPAKQREAPLPQRSE